MNLWVGEGILIMVRGQSISIDLCIKVPNGLTYILKYNYYIIWHSIRNNISKIIIAYMSLGKYGTKQDSRGDKKNGYDGLL